MVPSETEPKAFVYFINGSSVFMCIGGTQQPQ